MATETLEHMIATVTIPVDEYFDLRSKAETNLFLTHKLGTMEEQYFALDRRIYELENKIDEMRRNP